MGLKIFICRVALTVARHFNIFSFYDTNVVIQGEKKHKRFFFLIFRLPTLKPDASGFFFCLCILYLDIVVLSVSEKKKQNGVRLLGPKRSNPFK